MRKLSLIYASDINNVIGVNNKLPWHIPEDLAHFKETTSNSNVIMGRKTFESLRLPKGLPNRRNIVLTSKPENYVNSENLIFVSDIVEAINAADNELDIFIIGGLKVFELFEPLASRIYHTVVHTDDLYVGQHNIVRYDLFSYDKAINISTSPNRKYNISFARSLVADPLKPQATLFVYDKV